ncbi:TadE/TadG family type IV pilus assembly protein [Altererythrobacter lutimaris]|uniref:Pilus assembly protein n=1 Tax=Altererythrobacter lutimaris TaxID=2743979 RepID=A0A850HG32_9SPHN|nr:TadE/TadG family type IV pilus assembly protein [Altererythrobacter lutimaris]NVE93542.1 pilus assembly protein [Altererythrobacter lutimaris]
MIATLANIIRGKRSEDGLAATEFGLIAIPLFIMLLGGMDLAHQAYSRALLQGALNDAARRASVEDPSFTAAGSTLEERIKNTVTSQVSYIAPKASYNVKISNYFDFAGVGKPEKLLTDVDGNGQYDETDGDCFEDLNDNGSYDLDAGRTGVGGSDDVVFYEVTMSMPRLFPMANLMGLDDTMETTAEAAIRNQPYATQAVVPTVCGEPA